MENKIILAADKLMVNETVRLARLIGSRLYAIKIHDLFDRKGSEVIATLRETGVQRIWVDYKLHDIPETMRGRAAALAASGADIITVHASAGVTGMRAAKAGAPLAKIYAVTLLTSLEDQDIKAIYNRRREDQVLVLARMAAEAGMDGIVCSPQELALLHEPELASLERITPGVRSPGKDTHDQKRTGTPAQAVRDGATRLVIGRQLTEAKDPVAELDAIYAELAAA